MNESLSFHSRKSVVVDYIVSGCSSDLYANGNKLGAGVGVIVHNTLEFSYCYSVSSIRQCWHKIIRKS